MSRVNQSGGLSKKILPVFSSEEGFSGWQNNSSRVGFSSESPSLGTPGSLVSQCVDTSAPLPASVDARVGSVWDELPTATKKSGGTTADNGGLVGGVKVKGKTRRGYGRKKQKDYQ